MKLVNFFLLTLLLTAGGEAAQAAPGKYFERAIFVIFENTSYAKTIKQPFFRELADRGAHFKNFSAITHPSQGNYIALTSGDLNGVRSNQNYTLDVPHIADLLEAKGLTW